MLATSARRGTKANHSAEIDVETSSKPGARAQGGGLPFDIARYNRERPEKGWVTPVEVVRYFARAEANAGPPPAPTFGKTGPGVPMGPPPALTLMRQVNWGEPVSVASVETFQVRYVVGSTVAVTEGPRFATPPVPGLSTTTSTPYYAYKEETLVTPPLPQPDPAVPIKPQEVVAGVLVTVTTRSESANLVGSTRTERDPEGRLRKTLTSRATPRNVLYRLSQREQAPTFN